MLLRLTNYSQFLCANTLGQVNSYDAIRKNGWVSMQKTKSTLDDFNYWIIDMDDALERFIESFPAEIRSKLNFSAESLEVLEGWLLSCYSSKEEMKQPDQSQILNGIACYIGETFRKNAGGRWTIDLDNPKNAFFGVPTLMGYSSPVCPLAMATASISRQKGNFFRTILERNIGKVRDEWMKPA